MSTPSKKEVTTPQEMFARVRDVLKSPYRPTTLPSLQLEVIQTAILINSHRGQVVSEKANEFENYGVSALENHLLNKGLPNEEIDKKINLLESILLETRQASLEGDVLRRHPLGTKAYNKAIKPSITQHLVNSVKEVNTLSSDIIEGMKLGIAIGLDRFANAGVNSPDDKKAFEETHKHLAKYAEKTGLSQEQAYAAFSSFIEKENEAPDGSGVIGFFKELTKLVEDIFKGIQKGLKYQTASMVLTER